MAKRFVQSWDVFDTLIARRCVDPVAIFELMEAELGDGFAKARVDAETNARQCWKEISLSNIYDELQIANGWSPEFRQSALELEIRTELDNVIPISKNMSRVRDGDIVVSDMYLPNAVIMDLLRKAGLEKDIALFVSTNGKGEGSMWKHLKKRFHIIRHTGDNLRSDFLRPLLNFIPATLCEASAETPWESMLRQNRAPFLSAFVREMRLRNSHGTRTLRNVQSAQIEANFPLLLLASAALVHWCKQHEISRALMSSRDCILWAPLADKVARQAGGIVNVEYFLISRVAALKSSQEYLDYASKRIASDAVVVDLSMTGISLAGLADRLKITEVRAFVISWEQRSSKSLYGNKFQPKAKVNVEFLTAGIIKEDLEAVNQALSPSVHDVHETPEGLLVTYAAENRSLAVLEATRIQHNMFNDMVDRCKEEVVTEALDLAASNRLVFFLRECARQSASFQTVISVFKPGSALRTDPNGISLALPYARENWLWNGLRQFLKRLLKPLFPRGSSVYRLGMIAISIILILREKVISRFSS